jgi:hypothetical protein
MDHFEVRKFRSIQRHLFLSCLSHVFLSEFCLKHRGEKSGLDGMPGSHGRGQALSEMPQVLEVCLHADIQPVPDISLKPVACSFQNSRAYP